MVSAELRKQNHDFAKRMMVEENYFGALELMRQTQTTYGPHIGLLADISAVLYLLGRHQECCESTAFLEAELENCRQLVTNDSYCRTQIFLGKMREEAGVVGSAIKCYQRATERPFAEGFMLVRAQAQVLRLKSFLNVREGLPELYRACCVLKMGSEDLCVELEHALILAEIALFGIEASQARLESALQKEGLSNGDRNLLIIDFLEAALSLNYKLSNAAELISAVRAETLCAFEKCIVALAYDSNLSLTAKDLIDLNRQTSTMGCLRVLSLNLKRVGRTSSVYEIRRMLLFLLSSLGYEDRAVLSNRFLPAPSVDSVKLVFLPNENKVVFFGKEKVFKNKSFALKTIALFLTKTEISVENFALEIYGMPLSESVFERIRIGISRLNSEISGFTGISKGFTLTKTAVTLNFQLTDGISGSSS